MVRIKNVWNILGANSLRYGRKGKNVVDEQLKSCIADLKKIVSNNKTSTSTTNQGQRVQGNKRAMSRVKDRDLKNNHLNDSTVLSRGRSRPRPTNKGKRSSSVLKSYDELGCQMYYGSGGGGRSGISS